MRMGPAILRLLRPKVLVPKPPLGV
jgi:hypothetical protein